MGIESQDFSQETHVESASEYNSAVIEAKNEALRSHPEISLLLHESKPQNEHELQMVLMEDYLKQVRNIRGEVITNEDFVNEETRHALEMQAMAEWRENKMDNAFRKCVSEKKDINEVLSIDLDEVIQRSEQIKTERRVELGD